jgi:hypothetical protein
MSFISAGTLIPAGNFISAGQAGEILTGSLFVVNGAPVTVSGTTASLAGDVLTQFAAVDRLDITDFDSHGATVTYAATPAGGDLTIANRVQSVVLHNAGMSPIGGFSVVSDGHGGSLIGFS